MEMEDKSACGKDFWCF